MASARGNSKSGCFHLDDRSIGGMHMIQQQFQDMHRKIDHARKHVDNEPPMASMFKRSHFSSFGVDYRERVKERPMHHVHSRVDCSEPDSYPLIANLFINRRVRSQYAAPVRKGPKMVDGVVQEEGRTTFATRPRPLSSRIAALSHTAPAGSNTQTVLSLAAIDRSVQGYASSIADRLEDIAAHKAALRKRRMLRRQDNGTAAKQPGDTRSGGERNFIVDSLREAAQSALASLRHDDENDHEEDHGGFGLGHRQASWTAPDDTSNSPPAPQQRYTAPPSLQHVNEPPANPASFAEGALRGPVQTNDTPSSRPPPSGFPVPTPPPRSTTKIAPSPAHVKLASPSTLTADPAGAVLRAPINVNVNQRSPLVPTVSTTVRAVGQGATASGATSHYSGLRFPSTMTELPTSAPTDQVVTANDFIEPYGSDDDDCF